MRNEVFNSKQHMQTRTENVNNFTAKPIRGEDGNNQLCVTFNRLNSGFCVNYRLKGSREWIATHIEKNLNVINIKHLPNGLFEVRIVVIGSRQQVPSDIKEVLITDSFNKNGMSSEKLVTIANDLANDIIAEVYAEVYYNFDLQNNENIRYNDYMSD